jgi:hypothetical protein
MVAKKIGLRCQMACSFIVLRELARVNEKEVKTFAYAIIVL